MSMTPQEEAQHQWAILGTRAAMDGVAGTSEILDWLVQQPEILQLVPTAAAKTQEDSESSSPGAAEPELSYATRAAEWAEDIRSRPLTDPQAIELAKVYALLAIEQQLSRLGNPSELIASPTPGA